MPRRLRAIPTFKLRMQAEVTGLIEAEGRIAGVVATTPDGPLEIRADLTIGADGRHSTVREARRTCASRRSGAPIDVLWFRLARKSRRTRGIRPAISVPRNMFVMINRGDYWQCGYVIPKGGFDAIRAEGLPAFRARLVQQAPFVADAAAQLSDWNAVEPADGDRRPSRAMAPAGTAVHRRRRACDVAGGRRRHQSRDPGCGRRRQHPGRAAARTPGDGRTTSRACRRDGNCRRA